MHEKAANENDIHQSYAAWYNVCGSQLICAYNYFNNLLSAANYHYHLIIVVESRSTMGRELRGERVKMTELS